MSTGRGLPERRSRWTRCQGLFCVTAVRLIRCSGGLEAWCLAAPPCCAWTGWVPLSEVGSACTLSLAQFLQLKTYVPALPACSRAISTRA